MADPPPPGHDFHEQRTEWQEFKDKALDFWARFGTPITIVVVLLSLSLLGYQVYNAHKQSTQGQAANDLTDAGNIAPALVNAAEQHADTPPGYTAALRAGDLLLQQFTRGETVGATTPDQALTDAQAQYQRLVTDDAPPLWLANAYEGLAVVAECRSDWAAAKAAWAKAAEVADAAQLPVIAARANDRLGRIDTYANPTPFPAETDPTLTPMMDPELEALLNPAPQSDPAADPAAQSEAQFQPEAPATQPAGESE
ncbi:MAG: hypothetical protein AAF288_02210 [Planctomycetota bacterium]